MLTFVPTRLLEPWRQMIDVFKWVCDNVRLGFGDVRAPLAARKAGQKTPRCHRSHIMTAEPYGRILTDESYALSGPMLQQPGPSSVLPAHSAQFCRSRATTHFECCREPFSDPVDGLTTAQSTWHYCSPET